MVGLGRRQPATGERGNGAGQDQQAKAHQRDQRAQMTQLGTAFRFPCCSVGAPLSRRVLGDCEKLAAQLLNRIPETDVERVKLAPANKIARRLAPAVAIAWLAGMRRSLRSARCWCCRTAGNWAGAAHGRVCLCRELATPVP